MTTMDCKALEILATFQHSWAFVDRVFAVVKPSQLLQRPIDLRQPILFYIGHLAAFQFNQLNAYAHIDSPNPAFDKLFARGIDPDVDDPNQCHNNSAGLDRTEWPPVAQVFDYQNTVRMLMPTLVEAVLAAQRAQEQGDAKDAVLHRGRVFHMCWEHDTMHAETLLYMLNRLELQYLVVPAEERAIQEKDAECKSAPTLDARLTDFVPVPAHAAVPLGIDREDAHLAFGWDNESPRITTPVAAFEMRRTPITNGEFALFVAAKGYTDESLWATGDAEWRDKEGIDCPVHWIRTNKSTNSPLDGWSLRTLFAVIPLRVASLWPVQVSQAEARAYCKWMGARLPTEAEWMHAAYARPLVCEAHGGSLCHEGQFPWGDVPPVPHQHAQLNLTRWRPANVGTHPRGTSYLGIDDMVGNGWEWTSTVFDGFAGFEPYLHSYADYSRDFFDGKHVVVKGGSFATDTALIRPSFRNFYQARYPYVFSTFRPVRSVSATRVPLTRIGVLETVEDGLVNMSQAIAASMAHPIQPFISSQYLYDARGSELFEQITHLDEYYLTRVEHGILHKERDVIAELIISAVGPASASSSPCAPFDVVELGCGDGHKTMILVEHFLRRGLPFSFLPMDVSPDALESLQQHACESLSPAARQFLHLLPLVTTNHDGLAWASQRRMSAHRPLFVLYLGSSIGNYEEEDAIGLLAHLADALTVEGDRLLVGFDLRKDIHRLQAAYDDASGITKAFNFNLLTRLNRELHATFRVHEWRHHCAYLPHSGAMESWLIPQKDVRVELDVLRKEGGRARRVFTFNAFAGIRVERSHKYSMVQIERMAQRAGLKVCQFLVDEETQLNSHGGTGSRKSNASWRVRHGGSPTQQPTRCARSRRSCWTRA